MTLTIHIGMPKTGTTSIQQALHDNADALEAHGVDYLRRPDAPVGDHVHLSLSLGFGGDRTDGPEAAAYRTMLAARDPDRTAVLSTEHFSFFWRDPDAVARLADLTGPARIVAVLRNQVAWMPSMFGEGLKRGRQRPFHQVAPGMTKRCDYASYLAPWEAAFGREAIEPIVYEEGDVLDQFTGRALGLPGDVPLVRPPRANATPPQLLLEAVRRLGIEDRDACYALYRDALARVSRDGSLPKADVWPMPPALEPRLKALEASNREVARRYLGRDELFPHPLSRYAERYEAGMMDPGHAEAAIGLVRGLIEPDPWSAGFSDAAAPVAPAGPSSVASATVPAATPGTAPRDAERASA